MEGSNCGDSLKDCLEVVFVVFELFGTEHEDCQKSFGQLQNRLNRTKKASYKIVDDDIFLPRNHVALFLSALPNPVVFVRPGKQDSKICIFLSLDILSCISCSSDIL